MQEKMNLVQKKLFLFNNVKLLSVSKKKLKNKWRDKNNNI